MTAGIALPPRDAWRAEKAARLSERHLTASARPPAPRNVQAVLDLGNARYFTFRGRAYGVPPVPYLAGIRLQSLLAEGAALQPTDTERLGSLMQELVRLCWSLVQPVGRIRRGLRRLGLHRNPFADATEQEIAELASFCSGCRMMSRVGDLTPTLSPAPLTRWTS